VSAAASIERRIELSLSPRIWTGMKEKRDTSAIDRLAPGDHVIDVGGAAQWYHVAGSGPVCVVHPGGPGIGWEYLRMTALERHLTMVYLEPIGTGRSARFAHPDDYHIDRYAEFLAALVDHLDVPSPLLLGHSHGGFVAQRYALAHPDRLGGLVLYATSPLTGEEFWQAAVANVRHFPEWYPDRPEAVEIPAAFMAALAATTDAGYTDALRRILPLYFADPWAPGETLAALRAGIQGWVDPQRGKEPRPFDTRDSLPSLNTPTMALSGVHDFICGPMWTRQLYAAIPGTQLVLFQNSGHMPHIEQTDAFTAAVAGFARSIGTLNTAETAKAGRES
jgi:pimeloyl-ACP methyl ester carboxylesterase